ncbi:trypsin-like serine peptidase [Dongia deserti]|uniref:trypsin-like serine peptidase n=1 Tax=Dongia deserti TaxID=2268030 RepID=UPI0013C4CCFD|nr:trypsin-like serine protease [Dongia deserti]
MTSHVENVFPMNPEELRRRPREAAREEVPRELQGLISSVPPSKSVRFVERAAPSEAVAQTDSYRPAWIAGAFAPQRLRLPEPPVVTHRGHRLTPAIDCHFYGSDDRRIYNDTSYPWGCVCRITNANGRMGSGALIGPRHILTASHVVAWNTDVAEKIEVHFAGNAAQATVFDTLAYAYTQIQGDPGASTVDEDYAVLVINERLGDRFGWLGTKVYSSSWDDLSVWFNMGYAVNPGTSFPLFQMGKSMDEDEFDYGSGRAMTTNADICRIQSGSPMFGFWENDPGAYAVAVVSAIGQVFASGLENWCSGGSDLSRLVNQARNENP